MKFSKSFKECTVIGKLGVLIMLSGVMITLIRMLDLLPTSEFIQGDSSHYFVLVGAIAYLIEPRIQKLKADS